MPTTAIIIPPTIEIIKAVPMARSTFSLFLAPICLAITTLAPAEAPISRPVIRLIRVPQVPTAPTAVPPPLSKVLRMVISIMLNND